MVRTYPTPASKGVEVSCTAAISERGDWLRLFPIPYRFLKRDQRFSKYQWIEAKLKKATSDARLESYNVDLDSLRPLDEGASSNDRWKARKAFLEPLRRPSLEVIEAERDKNKHPTLGFFRPKRIKRLIIEADPDGPDWTTDQKAKLTREMGQSRLFESTQGPAEELEKIPYIFKYEFDCDDADCHGHTTSCTDWEMAQAYRKWRAEYGKNWESKFRQRFEKEMIERFETHFFVGTVHIHPAAWIIVGLFFPLLPTASEPEPLSLGL